MMLNPASPARYPLAIVGAGALGLSFAARLAALGPVAVIARSAARAAELRAGVEVGGRSEEHTSELQSRQ